MLWCPGRLAESERAGVEAVEVLESLEPGRELALAYANLSTFQLALSSEAAVGWANRAIELAERLGDTEIRLIARADILRLEYANGDDRARAALEEQVDPGKRRGGHGVERTAGTERRRSRTFQP